jgi:beta-glucosidase
MVSPPAVWSGSSASIWPGASAPVSVKIDQRLLADWKDGGWSLPPVSMGLLWGRMPTRWGRW